MNVEFVPISNSESNLINPDDLAEKEFFWERRNSYSEFGRTLSTKPLYKWIMEYYSHKQRGDEIKLPNSLFETRL